MTVKQSSPTVPIPATFALDPRITSRAARVYIYLAALEGKRPPAAAIARTLGMGRGTVTRALVDLEAAGYLEGGEN